MESRGGAFIIYPGSYLRYRDAMGSVGPGGYKGIAPEYSGELSPSGRRHNSTLSLAVIP